jgi:hypothetical protein
LSRGVLRGLWGLALLGGLVALAAVALAVAGATRDRGGEQAELEAIGVPPRSLRAQMVATAAITAVAGLLSGVCGGAALASAFTGLVALGADGRSPLPELLPAFPWPLAVALAVAAAAIATAAASVQARRASARTRWAGSVADRDRLRAAAAGGDPRGPGGAPPRHGNPRRPRRRPAAPRRRAPPPRISARRLFVVHHGRHRQRSYPSGGFARRGRRRAGGRDGPSGSGEVDAARLPLRPPGDHGRRASRVRHPPLSRRARGRWPGTGATVAVVTQDAGGRSATISRSGRGSRCGAARRDGLARRGGAGAAELLERVGLEVREKSRRQPAQRRRAAASRAVRRDRGAAEAAARRRGHRAARRATGRSILQLLSGLARDEGATVLLATHDPAGRRGRRPCRDDPRRPRDRRAATAPRAAATCSSTTAA